MTQIYSLVLELVFCTKCCGLQLNWLHQQRTNSCCKLCQRMELAVALAVVQVLFATLRCTELRQFINKLDNPVPKLKQLEPVVKIIKAVLHDAENANKEHDLPNQIHLWIEELKDILCEAEDYFDCTVTEAACISGAEKMSRDGLSDTINKLNAIASTNHSEIGFHLGCHLSRRSSNEAGPYVSAQKIISREGDTEKITVMLLESDLERDISFLSIVGIRGFGMPNSFRVCSFRR